MDVYTDLRVIIMKKSAPQEGKSITCPTGAWLTLGHMDWIMVETLSALPADSAGVCLDQVRSCSQKLSVDPASASMYSQPLYILREFPSLQRKAVNQFWEKPAAFMTITRVHSAGQGQAPFEEAIDQQLKDAALAYDGELPEDCLGDKVVYLYYRTLELSDIILVTKSDSAASLLTCIGRLYTLEAAGDIYSYYCIARSELYFAEMARARGDDCIPLISTRFAVRSAARCRERIKELQAMFPSMEGRPSPAFFITGIEDINLIAYDNSSRQLCGIFQKILSMEDGFWSAFDSSTTRLGIKEESLCAFQPGPGVGGVRGDLSRACKDVLDSFLACYQEHPFDQDWVRPLIELLNMLFRMSKNCVLWQVCYILLNGTRGIVRCVEELSKDTNFSGKKNYEIMRIVTGIDRLMEHIIRMEGELVHHPETRPTLFDIPANLLEFYLLFADQSAQYLQDREEIDQDREGVGRRCDYRLLLIPNLCEKISIHDRLNDQESSNRLLFVEIPLGLVYSPSSVICKLVHEVAHYSGETARNRDLRFSYLISCAALFLADELGVGGNKAVFLSISNQISCNYPEGQQMYMRQIVKNLFQAVDQIGQEKTYVEAFWNTYLEQMSGTPTEKMSWLSARVTQYRSKKGEELSEKLDKVLWEVESLFKETYADLAMLTLLGLSAKDYIDLLESVERQRELSTEVGFACRIERAALVLCAIDEENRLDLSSCLDRPLAKDVDQYCRILLDENADWTALPTKYGNCGYHSPEIAITILEYLRECFRMISLYDAKSKNQEERDQIRQNYIRFAKEHRFASLEFFKMIEDYRPKIINRPN